MNRSLIRSSRSVPAFAAALLLVLSAEAAHALDAAMGESACFVLKTVLPQVKGFRPEGARAQLVTSMAEKFEYDGKKLKQLQVDIDSLASAKCSKERDAWLALVGTRSLQEALR